MSDGTIKTVLVGIIPAFPKLQFSTQMASNVCITPTEKKWWNSEYLIPE